MNNEKMCMRLALGAAAGLAGTMVLQVLRTANQRWLPESQPPLKGDPGEKIVQSTKAALPESIQSHIPKPVEKLAPKLLGIGYGMSFGAAFAASRKRTNRAMAEGALLGLITWAVGYLGWLPKARLMPPIWKHRPQQVAMPIAEHALFGIATAAGYRWLLRRAVRAV